MPLFAVESPINDVASIGQRGSELPVEIGIILDNKKAHRELRLETADQRALHGIDGQPAHFAIVGQHCQQVDQAVPRTAKPRSHHRAGHTVTRDAHGGIKADETPGLALRASLFLVETMDRFGISCSRTRGVFSARGSERAEHQRGKCESKSAAHTRPYAPATELSLNGRFRVDLA
jgi:hypothetical protein